MGRHQLGSKLRKWSASLVLSGALAVSVPTMTEAASDVFFGDKLLQKGTEHQHVEKLQAYLSNWGYLDDEQRSGVYNRDTLQAVRSFQDEHNLLVDGVAGTQTIGALKILSQGDQGDVVQDLQMDLKQLGYYDFKVDGIFGPITHEAVKAFQQDEEIQVDGLAGPETYRAMHEVIREQDIGQGKGAVPSADPGSAEQDPVSSEIEDSATNQSQSAEQGKNSATTASVAPEPSLEQTEEAGSTASEELEVVQELAVEATAYTADCSGCTGVTATGIDLHENPDKKVIAVDPNVIPLGSTVEVEGYGTAVAGDVGGSVQGDRIDIFLPDQDDAVNWGRQTVTVRVLD